MKTLRPALLLALALPAVLSGCGTDSDPADAGPVAVDGPADDGADDPDTSSATEVQDDTDAGEPTVFLIPGFNYQGESSLASFVSLEANPNADVVKGPQGAWMMVGAGHTNAIPSGTKYIAVESSLIDREGEKLIGTKFKKRPVFEQPDGSYLMMNNYLIVGSKGSETAWDGLTADYHLLLKQCGACKDSELGGPFEVATTVRMTLKQTTDGPGVLP